MLLLHKVTFIVWVVFMSLHVLGHLPRAWAARWDRPGWREQLGPARATAGTAGRWIALPARSSAAWCWRSC